MEIASMKQRAIRFASLKKESESVFSVIEMNKQRKENWARRV